MTPLRGRVAVVTGGDKNIGRAVSLALAAAGADVAIWGKSDRAAAEEAAQAARRLGRKAAAVTADVADESAVGRAMEEAASLLGAPSILVNNAAARENAPFADLTFARWRAVLGVALDGAFLCARAVLPFMRAAGGGAIVNIGGLSGHAGASGRAHVAAAKAGVVGLTRALAVDLAAFGIRVNCVSPGKISTIRGANAGAPPVHYGADKPLIGEAGMPEDIAAAVVYLAGADAKYITGQTLHVNGGLFMP